jgi:hypothetical protein
VLEIDDDGRLIDHSKNKFRLFLVALNPTRQPAQAKGARSRRGPLRNFSAQFTGATGVCEPNQAQSSRNWGS